MKYYVLFNPNAGNNQGKENTEKVKEFYKDDELVFVDVTTTTYDEILKNEDADAYVITGGDGTLNYFINEVDCDKLTKDVFYYATGSGNDFLTDIGGSKGEAPIKINKYLVNLPTVTVNGMVRKFINGVGYGIDGYCCEVADKIKETDPNKAINYAGIAIKGLLFHYKPTTATIIVDGEEHVYKKAWLAPTMFGSRYGGGMIPTPNQSRLGDGSLSVMSMHGSGKIPTLIAFPKIFKGEHVNNKKMVAVHTGREITVKFDRPVALQIDGETVLNVTEYTAKSYSL